MYNLQKELLIDFFITVAPLLDFELKRVSDHEENKIEEEEIPEEFAQRFEDEGGFDNYMDQVRFQKDEAWSKIY